MESTRQAFALAAIMVLAITMGAAPRVARAQQTKQIPRIGYVVDEATVANFGRFPATGAFLAGMRDHGYELGRDFTLELRQMHGHPERYAELSDELVRLPVDILLASVCGEPLNAARRATKIIPIVVPTCNDDMVETGVIQSYRRPGGNVTGLSKLTPELAPKRLELLKRVVPTMSRLGVLWNPDYSDFKADWRELRGGAVRLGVTPVSIEYRRPEDFEAAFEVARRSHVEALIEFSDLVSYNNAGPLARLAAAAGLPSMFAFREAAEAGALMSYGPSIPEMWRRSADYVVRILRGSKPAEMAIEQPTRFEFVVNLNAAKSLGIRIPQAVLLEATDVIQ